MKAFLLLLFLGNLALAQQTSEPQMTAVAYFYTFKINESDVESSKENMNLLIDGKETSFQSFSLRKMDTINATKTYTDINDPERLENNRKYRSFHKYNIHTQGNEMVYHSTIGSDEYVYKETLDLDWQLGNTTKEIMGYTCKNATVNYGGREWEAWYAPDLPLNAGPYKFKGLPGLILKVTDASGNFDFEAQLMGTKVKAPLAYSFHTKEENQRVKTTREEFNKIKSSFESLSFNEKMNYGRTDGSRIMVTKMFDKEGNEESLRELDQAPEKKRVFIEIDG
jgi:GLPGLI family protein